jgi:acyl-CoA thioesterase II
VSGVEHPDLCELLDLDELASDLFVARSPIRGRQRVYGGQVVAQALAAAMRTVDAGDHRVHSLHGYFIRPGDETRPIVLDVARIRDGRSFTTRSVVARQAMGAIFNLSASFHRDEPDVDVAPPRPDLDVPAPETLTREEWDDVSDVRLIPTEEQGRARAWIRNARPDPLPASAWVHACALAYGSDHIPMDAIFSGHPGGDRWEDFMGASLDHSLWFHRPARADQWLLYDLRLQSLQGSRGVAHGTVHTADGALVATLVQEGLIRPIT